MGSYWPGMRQVSTRISEMVETHVLLLKGEYNQLKKKIYLDRPEKYLFTYFWFKTD